MKGQLPFDWPTGVALGVADFFVATPNAHAYAMLRAPDTWPNRKLVLTGPEGSGKSHLARIVQSETEAQLLTAATLPHDFRPDAPTVIVEDMEALPKHAEETMFHLHNHLSHNGGHLLMTARTAPSRWSLTLPDLASRMQATTLVQISNPDDALLQALIMKLFADRQIMPPPNVITYLGRRIERSFAAAADVVARLDRAALAQKRKITLDLTREVLDKPA